MLDRAEAQRIGVNDVCPLCAGGPGHSLFEKGGQRYFRCGHCGFCYGRSEVNANFQPRLDDYEPAYRQYLDATAVDEVNHDATLAWVEQHASLGSGALAGVPYPIDREMVARERPVEQLSGVIAGERAPRAVGPFQSRGESDDQEGRVQ
jgi:hypothetical protein